MGIEQTERITTNKTAEHAEKNNKFQMQNRSGQWNWIFDWERENRHDSIKYIVCLYIVYYAALCVQMYRQ